MLIPPMISIAGIDYKVVFKKDTSFKEKETPKRALYDALGKDEDTTELEILAIEQDDGLVAHIDFMQNRIVIGEELSSQSVDISFWHEIVHGIDFAMGYVSLADDSEYMPINEKSVEARSQLLLQVIKQVVAYNIEEATK